MLISRGYNPMLFSVSSCSVCEYHLSVGAMSLLHVNDELSTCIKFQEKATQAKPLLSLVAYPKDQVVKKFLKLTSVVSFSYLTSCFCFYSYSFLLATRKPCQRESNPSSCLLHGMLLTSSHVSRNLRTSRSPGVLTEGLSLWN